MQSAGVLVTEEAMAHDTEQTSAHVRQHCSQ
jgi:hypothetical protein